MKEYFTFIESSENRWFIAPKYDMFGSPHITGSYGVLISRFFGLSWVDWLKYCVQNGARLQGKDTVYVLAIWEQPNRDFLKEINLRMNEIAKHIDVKELKY